MTTILRSTAQRLAAVLTLGVVVLVGAPVAAAAAAPAQPGAAGPSFVRLAHLSPDTPNVDVYLASVERPQDRIVVPGVGYGSVSDYRTLQRGAYTVAMRPAGAPADSPPVITTTLRAGGGAAYTVAGVGYYRDLGLTVLDDDLSMPAPGLARVRVINAAATSPRVDVAADGLGEIASGVAFAGGTGYRDVPAGVWTLQVRSPGGAPVPLPVGIAPNTVYTVLLLDGPQGLRTELHTDSAGSAEVPRGSVETGGGGTAGPEWWPAASALVSLGAVGWGLAATRRRRSA